MRKLNKETVASLKQRYLDLDNAHSGIEAAIYEYNQAIECLNEERAAVANSIQEYMDERSEAWWDTDSCANYENWLAEFDCPLDEEYVPDAEHGDFDSVQTGVMS
jgi:hypothetical protein